MCVGIESQEEKTGLKSMVQWLELDMDAACSRLTHARALQPKFTLFVTGWLGRHSDQPLLRLSKM